jgi:hypothetical protein
LEDNNIISLLKDIQTKSGRIVKAFNIYHVNDLETLIKSFRKKDRVYYEVIQTNKPRKLYFDIDAKYSDLQKLNITEVLDSVRCWASLLMRFQIIRLSEFVITI